MESARCTDSTVVSCSVACVVALLGSLEDLSQGRGLSDEHIESLSKLKEPDNWETLKEQYDNAASARDKGNSFNGNRFNGGRAGYRWRMNSQGSPDGDIESLTERFEKDGGAWDSLTDGDIRNDGGFLRDRFGKLTIRALALRQSEIIRIRVRITIYRTPLFISPFILISNALSNL